MITVLVYTVLESVRDQVRLALGRSPAPGVDDVTYLMADEGHQVVRAVEEGLADLLVLDGEAWPTGGLGICRELKNADVNCPPAIVLIARRDDRWLAKWSQADAVLSHPVDPWELADIAVTLLGRTPAGQVADPALVREKEQV
ncbi:MAG TPA: hypothetical protein VNA14_09860 [Mycobacteriales bacterium]|nr:hypothetical protein [Mycobacteriales bacterium]